MKSLLNKSLFKYSHPLFFSVIPILSFFVSNRHEIVLGARGLFELILSCLFCIVGALIVLGVCSYFLKSVAKGALLSTSLILTFFSFTDIILLLHAKFLVLSFMCIVFNGFIAWKLWKTDSVFEKLNHYAKAVSLLVVGGNILFLSFFYIGQVAQFESRISDEGSVSKKTTGKKLPDVYFVLMDGYPNERSLKSIVGSDNQAFQGDLKSLGFFLPQKTYSNYAFTALSVPSMMNMDYISSYVDIAREEHSQNLGFPLFLLSKHRVGKVFQSLGYQFVAFRTSSNITPLAQANNADTRIDCRNKMLLERLFLENTPLFYLWWSFDPHARAMAHKDSLKCIFDELDDLPNLDSPKFVFIYLLCPHPPWVFDAEGNTNRDNRVAFENFNPDQDKKAFMGQLSYLNRQVVLAAKSWIKKSSQPPIIILTSDHGTMLHPDWKDDKNWETPSKESLNEVMRNFSAFYAPPEIKAAIGNKISPVNIFRILFSELFQKKLKRLPGKAYYSNYKKTPYGFSDVTDELEWD